MRSYRVAAARTVARLWPGVYSPHRASRSRLVGIYAALNGSDFDGFGSGLGVDAQFRYHARGGVSIGGACSTPVMILPVSTRTLGVRAFFAEVRYAFERASSPSITPYISARRRWRTTVLSQGGNSVTANGVGVRARRWHPHQVGADNATGR